MPPKIADTGAKGKQTGTLNSWLKTSSGASSRGDNEERNKRSRSESDDRKDSQPMETVSKKAKRSTNRRSEATETSTMATNKNNSKPPPESSNVDGTKTETAATTDNATSTTLHLTERKGDIFAAPPNTLIIHACNCQGSWGAGIAAAFRKNYPEAFKVYAKHCRDNDAASLVGTALLIPPAAFDCQTGESSKGGKLGAPRIDGKTVPSSASGTVAKGKKHFVGCLFTSNFYGKRRDSPQKILRATGPAMGDLLRRVREWNEAQEGEGGEEGMKVGEVRMCKINSGLFGVPWEDSVEVLEGIQGDGVKEVVVVEREEG